MEERKRRGFAAISESDYISWENSAAQLMREAGLPAGFYDDPTDFANWIGRNVSLRELSARVDDGYRKATQGPSETIGELQRLYGVSQGQLAAFFLDPDKALPLIQKQYMAAQEAAAARRTGFGQLDQTQAERLASLGIDPEGAQATFSQLAGLKEVASVLPGERQDTGLSMDEQLRAGFEQDQVALDRLNRKGAGRKAMFDDSGQVLTAPNDGILGLGTAQT